MPKASSEDTKLSSLRDSGTLNPHPDAVTDELFGGSEFFDPRDLVQVKYEMLRRVQKDSISVTSAADAFGFSRPSFYQAQSALQSGGLAGLVPLRRGPKAAHKLTDEVMDFVHQSRRNNPSLKTADLVALIKEQFDLAVHPRTLERGLQREQKKLRTPE